MIKHVKFVLQFPPDWLITGIIDCFPKISEILEFCVKLISCLFSGRGCKWPSMSSLSYSFRLTNLLLVLLIASPESQKSVERVPSVALRKFILCMEHMRGREDKMSKLSLVSCDWWAAMTSNIWCFKEKTSNISESVLSWKNYSVDWLEVYQ